MQLCWLLRVSAYFLFCQGRLLLCRWDRSLATLLGSLTKHLGKRLCFERSPRDAEDKDRYAAPLDAVKHRHDARRPLDDHILHRVAGTIVGLAAQAQFAKVGFL